jgi:CBS domain-containing protein
MRAKDAMTTKLTTVLEHETTALAAQRMVERGHGCLPVVDSRNHVVGIISKFGLVRQSLPSYLEQVGDLYQSGDFKPFDEKIRSLGALPVSQLMEPAVTVNEDTPLVEVAVLLVTHNTHLVCVVNEGIMLGVIGMQDVIAQIAWGDTALKEHN